MASDGEMEELGDTTLCRHEAAIKDCVLFLRNAPETSSSTAKSDGPDSAIICCSLCLAMHRYPLLMEIPSPVVSLSKKKQSLCGRV